MTRLMKFYTIRLFFLFIFFSVLSAKTYATHAMGADLTYKCLGNNQYRVRLSFYRDCNGINATSPASIRIRSTACNVNRTQNIPRVNTPQDVSPMCSTQSSECAGGETFVGVQLHIYEGIITIANCDDWRISYDLCCRNNAVTTLSNPGSQNTYIEAIINNTLSECNSSPVFITEPVPFICINKSFTYNQGAYDEDGDSLVYSLIPAYRGAGTGTTPQSVTYASGFSATQPLNGTFTLDSYTGNITAFPTQARTGVVNVKVTEYRDGAIIGSVMRDMQITVYNCGNNYPNFTTSQPYNISGGTFINGKFTVCAGQTLNFDVDVFDGDTANDVINISTNVPGVSFTKTGTNPATFNVSLVSTSENVGSYTFTLRLKDDYCPTVGSTTIGFPLEIVGIDRIKGPDGLCPTNANSGTLIALMPNNYIPDGLTINWSPSTYLNRTDNDTVEITLPAGTNLPLTYTATYNYLSCSSTTEFTIHPIVKDLVISPIDTTICYGQNLNLTTNANSTATVSYSWTGPGIIFPFNKNTTATPLQSGTYTLTANANSGACITSTQSNVTVVPLPIINSVSSIQPKCVDSLGKITISASGTRTLEYSIDNGSTWQTNNVFSNLANGSYNVLVRVQNLNNCSVSYLSNPIIINQAPAAISGNVSLLENVSCYGGSDGEIHVTASGGNGIYNYQWLPSGGSASNATNLTIGNYTLKISDSNNCKGEVSASITQPDSLYSTITSQTNVNCFGDSTGAFSMAFSGGTGQIVVSTNPNLGKGLSFSNLPSGTYVYTVTDQNACVYNKTITISQPTSALSSSVISTMNVMCSGNETGNVQVSASGGTAPYSYAYNQTLNNSGFFENIEEGTFSIEIIDNNGCETQQAFTIIQEDLVKPSVYTNNKNIYLNASGNASIIPNDINNNSWDSCGIANLSLSKTSFNCSNIGNNSVYLIVTDNNNNKDSATATITVLDTLKPIVNTQNVSIYLNANAEASITANDINNASSDNCNIQTLAVSKSNFNCSNVGSNSVYLSVIDVNGNKDSALATVTVIDTIRPNVITQNISVYLNQQGAASIEANQINNGSSDNCGIQSLSLNNYTFNCSNVGSNTVILTVTDVNGNTQSAQANVFVYDTIKPSVLTNSISINLDANGYASINTNQINNGSFDNCSVSGLSLSKWSFDCSNIGVNTVYLKATDVNGNVDSAAALVTVIDNIKPIVTTQNHQIFLNQNGEASTTVNAINNGSLDNCGIQNLVLNKSNFNCSNVGTNTVYLIVSDVNGNIDSASAAVTVIDTIKPIVSAQNIVSYLNASGTSNILAAQINNGSYDNCGIQSLSLNKTNFNCSNVGINQVKLTVTDVNGNFDTIWASVTVIDTIKPSVLTQNINVYLNNSGLANITENQINNNSFDNCGVQSISINKNAFDCSELGQNSIVLTATDVNSNQASANAVVTVIDTIAPILICKTDTAILNALGNASIVPTDVIQFSSDNCAITNYNLSQSNFVASEAGNNSITLTAYDISGNERTCTTNVFVIEVLPTVACQNTNLYLNTSGSAVLNVNQIDNGSSSLVGIANRASSKVNFDCSNLGTNQVWLKITNNLNYSDSCSANVNVIDTVRPIAQTQNLSIYLDSLGNASINANQVNNNSFDNCSTVSLAIDKENFDCSNVGANTVILTVTDGSGNIRTKLATVNVFDTIKPKILSQSITLALNASGTASFIPNDIDLGSNDACGIASKNLSQSSFNCNHVGLNNITYSVEDVNGNIKTTNIEVTIIDTITPTIITQNINAYLNNAGQVSIASNNINAGTYDNCSIDTVFISKYDFNCSEIGLNTIQFTAIDVNGNSKTASVTVTVFDTIKPIATSQNISIYLNANGQANINGYSINNGSSDACGIDTITSSKTNFDCSNVGANQVVMTVVDNNGNSRSAQALVNVIDTVKPLALTQNVTAYLDQNGQTSITANQVNNNSNDACGISNISINKSQFNCNEKGINTIQFTAIDVNGNSKTVSQNILVVDTIKPQIFSTQGNITATTTGSLCGRMVFWTAPTASDNCEVNLVSSHEPGQFFPKGTTTVTYTATDASGNSRQYSFNVIITDNQAPTISNLPQNVIVNTSPGLCSGVVTWTAPNIFDNCPGTQFFLSHASGSVFPIGTTTILISATDAANNSSSASFPVTVIDNQNPIISNLPNNFTEYINDISCSKTINWASPSFSDNCGIASSSVNLNSGSIFNIGNTTITYSVVDANNRSSNASFVVTLIDTVKPVVLTQTLNISLNNQGAANITAQMVNNNSSDNCGIDSMYVIPNSFDCSNIGSNLVTLYVIDNNGNINSNQTTVTISDLTAPIAQSQGLTVYLNNNGEAQINANQINNGSTDNCGIANLSINNGNLNCNHLGQNQITLTVTDNAGNTSTSIANVLVLDTITPQFATNFNSISDFALSNICGNNINWTIPSIIDNCATSLTSNFQSGDYFAVGQSTVNYTASDLSGNDVQQSFVVTIIDTVKPIINAQDITVYLNQNGEKTITPEMVNNNSFDNCGIASLNISQSNFNCTHLGLNTINFTATDVNGNSNSHSVTITVLDTIKPIANTQNLTVYLDNSGNTNITANEVNNNSFDACGISNISISKSNFNCNDIGLNQVDLIVTDNSGNIGSAQAIINVMDSIKPNATAQNLTVYLNQNGETTITPQMVNNGSTDNCFVANLNISKSTFNCNDIGANTIILTVIDSEGNQDTSTALITVLDTVKPMVNTQNISVYLNTIGQASITAQMLNNNSSDACGIASLSISQENFSCANLGANTIQLLVTDVNGNSKTANAIVTVIDTIKPIVNTQNINLYLTASGQAGITPVVINNNSSDACGIANMTLSKTVFNCNDVGQNQVNLTAFDNSGNFRTAQAIVTVIDSIKPLAVANNVTVYLNQNGLANITTAQINNNSSDICGIASYSLSKSSFNCSDLGSNNVIFTVTDNNGNNRSATSIVTVLDTITPIFASNFTSYSITNTPGLCGAVVNWTNPSIIENCSATLNSNYSSGAFMPIGLTTVTNQLTDPAGNSSSKSFTVYIYDNEAPEFINVPNNITVNADPNLCSAIVNWIPPSVVDNCSANVLSNFTSGGSFPVGTTTVNYTAVDDANNTAHVSFTVTVLDNQLPVINNLPSNITACEGTQVSFINPSASDNCGISNLERISGLASGSIYPIGTSTVTYRAIDIHGNQSEASFTVTVTPNPAAPVISAVTPLAFCFSDSAIISANISTGLVWNNNLTTNPLVVYQTQNIWARVIDANGCISNQSNLLTSIKYNQPIAPVIVANGSLNLCEGETVELICNQNNVIWSNGQTTNPIIVSQPGSYNVRYINQNGCESPVSSTVSVFVNPRAIRPTVNILGNNTFCDGDSTRLVSTGNFIVWSNGKTGNSIYVKETGNYTSISQDPFNNCESFESNSVSVIKNNKPNAPTISQNGNFLVSTISGNFVYNWYRNDTLIQSSGNSTLELQMNATYYLIIENAQGCQNISNSVVVTNMNPVGINSIELENSISIFPNPTRGQFVVKSDFNEILTLTILDDKGKVITSVKSNFYEPQFMGNELANGVYYLRFETPEKVIAIKRLIKVN